MPEEIMIIVIIAIISGSVVSIVKTVVGNKYSDRKDKPRLETPSSASMTTSELKAMLRETVTDATQPLVERIERLEDQMYLDERDLPALNAADANPLLERSEEVEKEEAQRGTRRPVR